MLDSEVSEMFDAATTRFRAHEVAYKTAQRDAKTLATKIIGKRALILHELYEIAEVRASYDGTFAARGYRILVNGKRGHKLWDIRFLTARHFHEAEALGHG